MPLNEAEKKPAPSIPPPSKSPTHSPVLTRFHCRCLNWISVYDMWYDAKHMIMEACVSEHLADFHLLTIGHFRTVLHRKKSHMAWMKTISCFQIRLFYFRAAGPLLYIYCQLALWACLTSSLTMPRPWGFFLRVVPTCLLVKMKQDGAYCDRMMVINSRMTCGLLRPRLRRMRVFGDFLQRCEPLRCQGNPVLLRRKVEGVRFPNGRQ